MNNDEPLPPAIVNKGMIPISILSWPLVAVVLLQCSADPVRSGAQNQIAMDTTKQENPVYSRTDTGKVDLPESEWKKILSPDVYYIARQKGTERPLDQSHRAFKRNRHLLLQGLRKTLIQERSQI